MALSLADALKGLFETLVRQRENCELTVEVKSSSGPYGAEETVATYKFYGIAALPREAFAVAQGGRVRTAAATALFSIRVPYERDGVRHFASSAIELASLLSQTPAAVALKLGDEEARPATIREISPDYLAGTVRVGLEVELSPD